MLVADLFADIHRNVANNELSLPSLPDIALRVQNAAADPNCNFSTIGKVVKSDPALSTQLIRMANGPLYRSRVAVTNVRSAVHRIGVPGVRNFATTFALRNLFHSYNRGLNRLFRQYWQDSCEISALTAVLATVCAGFDPDDALLAGLLQDVGVLILLGQLAGSGEDIDDSETLSEKLDEWAPRFGQMALTNWELDQRYIDVASARHQWLRDTGPEGDLADLVTLARLHRYALTSRLDGCPPISDTPAYRKLPVGPLSPGLSLQVLDEAQGEVSEISGMLLG